MAEKLPQKLDELNELLEEVGLGWLLKINVRTIIDKLRVTRITEKLVEVAEAGVDDYFTSNWAKWSGLEKKFRELAADFVRWAMDQLDRWAR